MADHGITLLRISLGVVYVWFGVLKFFPAMSPAEDLVVKTIYTLSFGLVPGDVSMPILAAWECLIGLGLAFGVYLRATLLLLALQMIGTITPVFLFPGAVFIHFPYALSLEGQYIIKNLVIISSAIVIGSTVRGGEVIADPIVAREAKQKEAQRATKEIDAGQPTNDD
ncbi:MAG: DoxX family membrane protein [Anaerolineales bacterium]